MESTITYDTDKSVLFALHTLKNGKFMFVVTSPNGCAMNNGKQYDNMSTCFDAAREFMFDFMSQIRFLNMSDIWSNTK